MFIMIVLIALIVVGLGCLVAGIVLLAKNMDCASTDQTCQDEAKRRKTAGAILLSVGAAIAGVSTGVLIWQRMKSNSLSERELIDRYHSQFQSRGCPPGYDAYSITDDGYVVDEENGTVCAESEEITIPGLPTILKPKPNGKPPIPRSIRTTGERHDYTQPLLKPDSANPRSAIPPSTGIPQQIAPIASRFGQTTWVPLREFQGSQAANPPPSLETFD